MSSQARLPTGWVTATLGEVLPIAYGKGLTKAVRNETGNIPVFGSSGEVGRHDTPLTEGPAIIIGRKGTVGAVYYSPSGCWPIDTVYFAQGTPSTNLRFLSYVLRFLQLGKLDRSTAVPGVSRDDYNVVTTNIPPLPEQHRIVEAIESYLTRLDDAVATLERVKRNLERYRTSVLKAAVEGRLVPTEAQVAKDEGRDYEPASVLLERILKERRRRWIEDAAEKARAKAEKKAKNAGKTWTAGDDAKAKDLERAKAVKKYKEPAAPDTEGLPGLPEGWCWATWQQIGLSQNGRAFPSKEYRDHGMRLLRPGNLHASGVVEWTKKNTRHMPLSWAEQYPDFVVGPNEIVMNLTAQSLKDAFLGRVCMTAPDDKCLLNQRIARLTPVQVEPGFVLWLLKSPIFRKFVSSLNTGSLIQHMFTSQLDEFNLTLPPAAEQRRIKDEIERHSAIAEAVAVDTNRDAERVTRLRQSILKWAFEGKLVDQDPNDEPASVLLERIKAEKAKMEKPKKNKKKVSRKRRAS